jgi:ribonuclease-3
VSSPPGSPMAELQASIGHRFADTAHLELALLHRSHAAESGSDESYERLEFLGDAVLQLAVTDYLYREYADLAEGEMAKVRAAVVDAGTLAGLGRRFGIGPALLLGRGEGQTGGRDKDSILADVVEAILGAVYLDAGYGTARDLVLRHWRTTIDRRAASPGRRDYKTRLQERLAVLGRRPHYIIGERGPEHAKEFTAEVWDGDALLGRGKGTSKKRAEQDAARDAAERLPSSDA